MFDFFKNLFSTSTNPTNKSSREEQVKSMTITANTVKEQIGGAVGEKEILQNVASELYALYPNLRIDDDLLRDFMLSVIYGEKRNLSMVERLKDVLPDCSKKEISDFAGNISSLSSFYSDSYRRKKMGIEWYIWHSLCPQHKHLEGVLVRWDSPPSLEILNDGSPIPHHAGSQYGCNCLAYPVIMLDTLKELKSPYKVCFGDKIEKMKKKDFLQLVKFPI